MKDPPTPPPPHPATLPAEELLKQCDTRRLRRSGPGGQHRNKVETAVALRHVPTGVEAEASERRSQAQNAAAALRRLRVRLAVRVRAGRAEEPSPLWRRRAAGGAMRVSPSHHDFPALLAEALDWLVAGDGDDRQTADTLEVSRTSLLNLLRSEPSALAALNELRAARGLGKLR